MNELADVVERAWVDGSREHFPEIAARALADLELSDSSALDGLRWASTCMELPKQLDTQSQFGQPALQVVHRRGFHVELLYWFDASTDTHQHGFSGAFRVLSGASLHTRYEFAHSDTIETRLQVGALRVSSSELLERGDVRSIPSGPGLIHSLFHLEHPSVTLVVRTRGSGCDQPQFSYWKPGWAVDPRGLCAMGQRRVQCARALARVDPEELTSCSREVLCAVDFFEFAHIVMVVALDGVPRSVWSSILEQGRERYGGLIDRLGEAVRTRIFARELVRLRATVRSARSRRFLGALAHCNDRCEVLRAMGFVGASAQEGPHLARAGMDVYAELPEGDPSSNLWRWFAEPSFSELLAENPAVGRGSPVDMEVPSSHKASGLARQISKLANESELGPLFR